MSSGSSEVESNCVTVSTLVSGASDDICGRKLMIIDNRISDILGVVSTFLPNVDYYVFDSATETFDYLLSELNSQYESVAILQHNFFMDTYSLFDSMPAADLSGVSVSDPELKTWQPYIQFVSNLSRATGALNLDLLACSLWSDSNWRYVIAGVEAATGVHIRSSVNVTGAGGDFILESDNVNLIGEYFTPDIMNYKYKFAASYTISGSGGYSVTTYGSYDLIRFTSGTNTISISPYITSQSAYAMVVGGGGGGGSNHPSIKTMGGQGGGNAGLNHNGATPYTLSSGVTYTTTVGQAGNGGSNGGDGGYGANSTFSGGGITLRGGFGSGGTAGGGSSQYPSGFGGAINMFQYFPTAIKDAYNSLRFCTLGGDGSTYNTFVASASANGAGAGGGYNGNGSSATFYGCGGGGGGGTSNSTYTSGGAGVSGIIYLAVANSLQTVQPTAPTINTVAPGYDVSGNTTLLINFTAGDSGNDPAFTSYTYTLNGTSYTTTTQLTSPIVIPNSQLTLANGSSYTITLAATNSKFTSPTSSGVSGNTYLLPGPPTGVSATSANISANVSWTAPTILGVPSLSSYQVTASYIPTAGVSFNTPTITTGPTTSIMFTAVSAPGSNQLVFCGDQNNGSNLYYARNVNGTLGSFTQVTTTFSPAPANSQYLAGAINSAGTRLVVCKGYYKQADNRIYWADTTNILNYVSNTLSFTQILETTQRIYFGLSMTADGSRMVAASLGDASVYFSVWNGTNYSTFTKTLDTSLTVEACLTGITMSSDGSKIAYITENAIQSSNVFWASWNGTNYGTGTAIGGALNQGRSVAFSSDASVLIAAMWFTNSSSYPSQMYSYWNGSSYTTLQNIPSSIIPFVSNAWPYGINIDASNTLYYYPGAATSFYRIPIVYTSSNPILTTFSTGTTQTSLVVSPLLKNTAYTFSVKSQNAAGFSATSSTASATTPNVDRPGSPTISSSSVGNGSLTFTYTAPTYLGTPSLTGYYYTMNDGSNISIVSGTYTITVSGLLNQTYTVKVYATNGQLSSATPGTVALTPYLKPNPPNIISAVGGNNSVVLTFTDGSANGSAITTYKYSLNNGTSYTSIAYASFVSPYTISGLTPGNYTLLLRDVNAAGDSIDASAAFMAKGVPSMPVITGVTISSGSATVYYTDASNGYPLTNVWYNLSGGTFNGTVFTDSGSTTSPFTISGLSNGVLYSITLKSANSQGNSAVSAPSSFSPTIAQSPPGAPTINSITAANGSLIVSFTQGINAGSPVIGFKYSTDGTNYYLSTASATATSLTIPNLTNGTNYTVYIKTTNGAGDSAASSSMSGMPAGVPSMPFITGISSTNSSLVVSYTDGSSNGSAISGYTYSLNGTTYTAINVSGGTFTLSSPVVSVGSSYTVYLKSQNAIGSSVASNPYGPVSVYAGPISPVLGTVSVSDGQLSIAFTQASNGYPIIRYEWAIQGGAWTSLSSYFVANSLISPLLITGLTNGTSYTVYLRSVTSAGSSTAVSTTGIPLSATLSAPIITSVVAGNATASVYYTLGNTNGSGYSLLYSLNGGSYTSIAAASPLVITGLTNATAYTVAIQVQNGTITSAASNTSLSFTPGATPTAPSITSVSTTTSSATVYFTDGTYYNFPVLGYKYSLNNGATYYWSPATSSPLTINVSAGTQYNFKILTVTPYGTSPASNLITASSTALELNAPIITSIVAGNASVRVYFTNGASTGLSITGYKYSINNGSTFQTATNASGGVMTVSSGLTNGTTYTVIMQAVSGAVVSPNSNTSNSFIPTVVPDAPTITGVTIGDRTASINFTDGSGYGYSILGYKYSLDGTNYYIAPGSPSSPIVLAGLTNGTSYTVRLKAFTQIGDSSASSPSAAFVPAIAPSAPTIVSAAAGNQSIVLTIIDGNTNGSAITQYSYSLNSGAYTNFASTSKPLVVSGLTNGDTYSVSIKATTAIGTSVASNVVSAVPVRNPDAPAITGVTPGDKFASIRFTSGSLQGGSLIGYMYSLNNSTDMQWASGTSSPLKITGLTNGTSYTFTLYTVSSVGTSVASTVSAAYVPFSVPSYPTVSSIVSSDQQITVTIADGSANGSPIISRKYSFDGVNYSTVVDNPFTITGLTNGESYSVYVISTNAAGDSSPSLLSDVAIPYGAPGAPEIVSVFPSNNALRVIASEDNMNGANLNNVPILGYAYSFDGTNYTYQIDTSSNEFTTAAVLTNGVPAQISIKRITSFGNSLASELSNYVTPCIPPDAPTLTSIVPRDKYGVITFTDGSANGSPILGYKYSFDNVYYITALQTSSPITMYELTNAFSYTVYLKAFSSAGDSEPVVASQPIIPYGVPFAPVITKIEPGDKCAYVYFDPINNNGSPISLIRYSIGGSYLDVSGTTSPIVVPNLNNGGIVSGKTSSPYSIYIAAVNTAGISAASNTKTIIPGVPLAPVVTNLVSIPDAFRIEFTPPASENGSPITAYFVNYAGLKDPLKLVGLTSPFTVPNLTNGVSYAPVIYAVNKIGRSINSNAFGSVMPCKAPSKIAVLNATAYYQYTQLDFAVPNSNGAAITKYVYSLVGDTTSPWYDASGLSSPIILYNTPVNVAFTVKLAAVNALGTSEVAVTAKATRFTFTIPATIKTPTVTIGLGSMTVVLIPPATVGSNITKYSYSLNTGPYRDFSGLIPPFTIDISNNVDYNIQVTATNLAGVSVPSAPMAKPVRYVYLPPATGPAITSVLPITNGVNVTSGAAVVTFTPPAPAAIRNAPITGYAYTLDSSAGTPISMGNTSPVTITGISNMVPRTLYVYAVTAVGLSIPTVSKPFTISYGVPSAPVIKSATFVSQTSTLATFSLAVTPPVALNGSAVSKYYYSFDSSATYSDVGTFDVSGANATMSVTNVPNDVSTNIYIAAENTAGVSSWSVLPAKVIALYRAPSAPTIGVPTATANSITIPFTASLPNGSPVTDYLISLNGATATSAGLTTPITVNGLSGKTAYSVILYAVNSLGTSAASKAVSITTK